MLAASAGTSNSPFKCSQALHWAPQNLVPFVHGRGHRFFAVRDAECDAMVILAIVRVTQNTILMPYISSNTFPSLSTPPMVVSTAVSMMTMDGSGFASLPEDEQRMENIEDAHCNYGQQISMSRI